MYKTFSKRYRISEIQRKLKILEGSLEFDWSLLDFYKFLLLKVKLFYESF